MDTAPSAIGRLRILRKDARESLEVASVVRVELALSPEARSTEALDVPMEKLVDRGGIALCPYCHAQVRVR